MSCLNGNGMDIYIATGGADPHRHVVMLHNTKTNTLFDLTPTQALEAMEWLEKRQEDLRAFIKAEEQGL